MIKSKKARATISGMVISLIVGMLAIWKIDVPPDVQAHMVEVLIFVIGAIAGAYNISQGYADGRSMGRTSSAKRHNETLIANIEKAHETSAEYARRVMGDKLLPEKEDLND